MTEDRSGPCWPSTGRPATGRRDRASRARSRPVGTRRRPIRTALVLLFVVGSLLVLTDIASAVDPIQETGTVRYDETDDELRFEYEYDVSRSVVHLELTFDNLAAPNVEVVETRGLHQVDETTLEWSGSNSPSVVIRADPEPLFDTSWYYRTADNQFAPALSSEIEYRYRGSSPPGIERSIHHAGDGVVGKNEVLSGPHVHERAHVDGVTVNVVVPRSVDRSVDAEAILDLYVAGEELTDSRFDLEAVDVFVVPSEENEARYGTRVVGNTVYLDATATGVGGIYNVPSHEYFHTRFGVFGSEDTYWLKEASAQYYGYLLSLNTGLGTFEEFRGEVRTDWYGDAVLADHRGSSGGSADYQKGAQVLAALDAQIRRQTGGRRTLLDVVTTDEYDLDTYRGFEQAVVDVTGNESMREWLHTYVRTSATPEVPDDPELFLLGDTTVDDLRTPAPRTTTRTSRATETVGGVVAESEYRTVGPADVPEGGNSRASESPWDRYGLGTVPLGPSHVATLAAIGALVLIFGRLK